MYKIINIISITIIIIGIALFIITAFLLRDTTISSWCYGLGAAMIILGLGSFINSLLETAQIQINQRKRASYHRENTDIPPKYRSGYLVCKLMNILLCLYLLLLDTLNSEPLILFIGIAIVIFQFLLDLVLQIYFSIRSDQE
jgi:uncharacterized oligopeptide transporter (OPT) family protein